MYKFYYTNGYGVTSYIRKSTTSLWQIAWNPNIRKWLMRINLTCLMLFIAFMQVSVAANAQKISLSKKNAPLTEIFKELRKQSGYDFVINKDQIKIAKPVTILVNGDDLINVLNKCFDGQPFTYSMEDKMIIVVNKKAEQVKVNAPPIDVNGRLVNENGTALVGASVSIKGTDRKTITNENGEFSFLNVDDKAILVISFIGYEVKEIFAMSDLRNVRMIVSTGKLDEVSVVSTGYQSLPKERATGSFVQLNNANINQRISPNILDRLEGNVPGLIFNKNTLASSSGLDLSIRGHSTIFGGDQPLIILDNFPFDGNFNNINPNDIESITILKDAAASSIWGVKSGNGVIVITTKKARKNQKLSIEVNTNVTVGEKPDLYYSPNFLNSDEFINIEKSLYSRGYYTNEINSTSRPTLSPVVEILSSNSSEAEKTSRIDALRGVDVRDDLSKYFYRSSVNQQYNFNLKSGGEKNDFFLSAGYDANRSNLVGNSSSRLTFNTVYNFSPIKQLDFSIGLNYVGNNSINNSTVNDVRAGVKGLYPYAQLRDDQGNNLSLVKDYATSYVNQANSLGLLDWKFRPLDELNLSDNTNNSIENRINAAVKYKIWDEFSVDLKYQFQSSTGNNEIYASPESYNARNTINRFTQISPAGIITYPVPLGGIFTLREQKINSQRLRAQVNYSKNWNEHQLNTIAGWEISDLTNESNANTTYGYRKETATFVSVDYNTLFSQRPSGTSKVPNALGFTSLADRFISYFANAGYTYKSKYTLSVSGRIDKSNLFGVNTNQKSIPLFSAGIAWKASEEDFLQISWLPYLNLRATFGYNGNLDKTVAAVTTIRQVSNSYLSGFPFATIASPGNPELRWEKISMLNLALDYSLKDNLISGSFEYFQKKGIDLIGDSPLPGSTGRTTFRGNTANTQTKGFDLVINSNVFTKSKFKLSSSLMVSYALDKVTHYGPKATVANYLLQGTGNNGTILPLENMPLFAIYSYKWAGLDPANGNPRGYLNGKVSSDYAAIIAATPIDSLELNGTSRPKYFGAFRNTVSIGKFSLSANIIFKFDYFFRRTALSYQTLYQTWAGHSDYLKRWRNPGDEINTDVPSETALPINSSRENFYQNSSALVSKGDHIRLQDINLSYNINVPYLEKIGIRNLKSFCYVNNIGILWRSNKQHLDPDLYSSGMPLPRTISFGIKAQL